MKKQKPFDIIIEKLKYYQPQKILNKRWKNNKWEYFEDVSFNKFSIEIKNNLDKLVEFENNVSILGSGIYLIEDFYIGQTSNIINRVTSHLIEIFYEEYDCKTYYNKDKCERIKKVLSERKLKVKLIDSDKNREAIYINELNKTFNLTNHIGVKTKKKKYTKQELNNYNKILELIKPTIQFLNK